MGTFHVPLLVLVFIYCEYVGVQGYVPSYLKNKYSNLGSGSPQSGVKTSYSKTSYTKTNGYGVKTSGNGANLNSYGLNPAGSYTAGSYSSKTQGSYGSKPVGSYGTNTYPSSYNSYNNAGVGNQYPQAQEFTYTQSQIDPLKSKYINKSIYQKTAQAAFFLRTAIKKYKESLQETKSIQKEVSRTPDQKQNNFNYTLSKPSLQIKSTRGEMSSPSSQLVKHSKSVEQKENNSTNKSTNYTYSVNDYKTFSQKKISKLKLTSKPNFNDSNYWQNNSKIKLTNSTYPLKKYKIASKVIIRGVGSVPTSITKIKRVELLEGNNTSDNYNCTFNKEQHKTSQPSLSKKKSRRKDKVNKKRKKMGRNKIKSTKILANSMYPVKTYKMNSQIIEHSIAPMQRIILTPTQIVKSPIIVEQTQNNATKECSPRANKYKISSQILAKPVSLPKVMTDTKVVKKLVITKSILNNLTKVAPNSTYQLDKYKINSSEILHRTKSLAKVISNSSVQNLLEEKQNNSTEILDNFTKNINAYIILPSTQSPTQVIEKEIKIKPAHNYSTKISVNFTHPVNKYNENAQIILKSIKTKPKLFPNKPSYILEKPISLESTKKYNYLTKRIALNSTNLVNRYTLNGQIILNTKTTPKLFLSTLAYVTEKPVRIELGQKKSTKISGNSTYNVNPQIIFHNITTHAIEKPIETKSSQNYITKISAKSIHLVNNNNAQIIFRNIKSTPKLSSSTPKKPIRIDPAQNNSIKISDNSTGNANIQIIFRNIPAHVIEKPIKIESEQMYSTKISANSINQINKTNVNAQIILRNIKWSPKLFSSTPVYDVENQVRTKTVQNYLAKISVNYTRPEIKYNEHSQRKFHDKKPTAKIFSNTSAYVLEKSIVIEPTQKILVNSTQPVSKSNVNAQIIFRNIKPEENNSTKITNSLLILRSKEPMPKVVSITPVIKKALMIETTQNKSAKVSANSRINEQKIHSRTILSGYTFMPKFKSNISDRVIKKPIKIERKQNNITKILHNYTNPENTNNISAQILFRIIPTTPKMVSNSLVHIRKKPISIEHVQNNLTKISGNSVYLVKKFKTNAEIIIRSKEPISEVALSTPAQVIIKSITKGPIQNNLTKISDNSTNQLNKYETDLQKYGISNMETTEGAIFRNPDVVMESLIRKQNDSPKKSNNYTNTEKMYKASSQILLRKPELMSKGTSEKPDTFNKNAIKIEMKRNNSTYSSCTTQPTILGNAALICTSNSGCVAECIPNYKFPNGNTQLHFKCENGQWKGQGTDWVDTAPACEPICELECLNNGICMAPNECNCQENFFGPQCQYENKPCLNAPLLPMNAMRRCTATECSISCLRGHKFPDGSQITTMQCKDGEWTSTREGWELIPDCEPICEQPCQNGGKCLSFNVCQCSPEFRGPQCQYAVEVCNPKRIGFNGAYNCSGNADLFSCTLSCPAGIPFEFTPAPLYLCYYANGYYEPQNIPLCVFPENTIIQPGLHTKNTMYHQTAGSSYDIYQTQRKSHTIHHQPQNKHEYTNPQDFFKDSNVGQIPSGNYEIFENETVIVEKKLPKPGTCFTWGGSHYKTFDGRIFSFDSDCSHTLLQDSIDNTFSISIQNNKECKKNPSFCYKVISVYFQDKQFYLKQSETGFPVFKTPKKILPIPAQLPGLRVYMIAHYIIMSLDTIGVKIKWDGSQMVQLEVTESLWNRTEGLCGKIDGEIGNDLSKKDGSIPRNIGTFATSWKVDTLEDICIDMPNEETACTASGKQVEKRAYEFCKQLLTDPRFLKCQTFIDAKALLDACTWDFCSCKKEDPKECACDTLNVLVKDCEKNGISGLNNWRDQNVCPMTCTGCRIYQTCGPSKGQSMCGSPAEFENEVDGNCVEGCYCPDGTVLHENNCITVDKCPCRTRGKTFAPGSEVQKDCNTCICSGGLWTCTEVSCGARCSAVGDPHYITFDGKAYDFMGQCSYYLVKNDNFTIEAENTACAGSISKAMNFPVSVASGLPSCTKTVTIKMYDHIIKLKQNHDVVVNGQDLIKLPFAISGIQIKAVSSFFIQVILPNQVEIMWDGVTRVYIDAPPSLKGQTKGLCGTFNSNQKDDFLTPENDIEQSVVPFANKWKTAERCDDVKEKISTHPCDANMHKREIAEKHCQNIKSDLFKDCHFYVDPELWYQNCLYDMCACENKVASCLCPIMSAYAEECSRNNVKINWRFDVRECGIYCPGGQKYQICGNSCARTCSDVSLNSECKPQCVEGCNCPEGMSLDEHGECISINQCKCQHDGIEYPAMYKEIRPATKGLELCTCVNANWKCNLATPKDIQDFPRANDAKAKCDNSLNMQFTTCEPPEPVTCKNMHKHEGFTPTICHAGCKCKDGYVMDTKNKRCVKPQECPCHHSGRSYKENATVQSDCNTCQCKNGKWDCTNRQCTAECSAWGDSHYKTFDGKHFDYQGQCDYVLAKGSLSPTESFDITIQNVPCGSLGTSCSKSVKIKVVSGTSEIITLTAEKPLPDYHALKHLTLRHKDLFVIVEAIDLGVIVQWDKGTRVYVKVHPKWKNEIKGLCGNYNDNDADDFQTPSGGLAEASALIFGDSWRLQSYCPEAIEITNTCEDRPDRKVWALKKCGILKTQTFAACHSEVPLEYYFEKCVFDSCACDQGGDCECMCTALAAYAQECNNKGVPIKWRSQELCPIQCDERCSTYDPCVSTCPIETCDNIMINNKFSKACKEDSCVEGCSYKRCPPGQIYTNSSHLECVPVNVCKPVCLEVDGVNYYEGDLIEEDDCHSCHCSRGKKVCTGQPCTTMVHVVTEAPAQLPLAQDQLVQCIPGWTEWINQNKPLPQTKNKRTHTYKEIEPIPDNMFMINLPGAKCSYSQMANIECRTSKTRIAAKKSGLEAECSLESGLICNAGKGMACPDFEIRIYCECEYIENPLPITEKPAVCDVSKPNQEHPTNCHLFYQCVDNNGIELVEKTCGNDMMYNPMTMVCDFPSVVSQLRPECDKPVVPEPKLDLCPNDMIFDECATHCDSLCHYYSEILLSQGKCKDGVKCESGCVPKDKKLDCPNGMFWASDQACVSMSDCMCRSSQGKPMRPGQIETHECKECQCMDNYYSCKNQPFCQPPTFIEDINITESIREPSRHSQIDTEKQEVDWTVLTTVAPVFILPATVTPPEDCPSYKYIDLIQGDQPLPDKAFRASSYLSPAFAPWQARLNNGTSWSPEFSNQNQYLEIDLGRLEPIYGVIIRGNSDFDEYVTSFRVLYSSDNTSFFYVLNDENHPHIFTGPGDKISSAKTIFKVPFEAQILRINPQTWTNGISLKVELIGCGEGITTTEDKFFTVTIKPAGISMCDDEMGFDNYAMNIQQVSTSSDLSPEFDKSSLRISDDLYWQPLSDSPTEWIQFDFLEPRNVTGLITKGGDNGWVTTFTIKYAHNENEWSPILDEDQKDKIFVGNYDSNSTNKVRFDIPVCARFIKIVPKKWHNHIQMQVEMIGCFKPYPEIEHEYGITTVAPSDCDTCPGVEVEEMSNCRCTSGLWWSGKDCVNRTQCSCMVNHITYAVGATFEKEDCSQCICKLGGISNCNPKKCDKCQEGLRSTVTSTCACTCKPCPEGTMLCPTSNICIDSKLWCNGVTDCPDDESDCPTEPPMVTTIAPTTKKPKTCPIIECKPGSKKMEKSKDSPIYLSSMISDLKKVATKTFYQMYKGKSKNGVKGGNTNFVLPKPNKKSLDIEEEICKEYRCVPEKPPPKIFVSAKDECPPANCQDGYVLKYDNDVVPKECPKYSCYPPPPPDAVCNVTGKTFNTFDKVEYKYDICNHVIARDLKNDQWEVTLKKNCSNLCSRDLHVRHNENNLVLHPDLSIDFNSFHYTKLQLKKIASNFPDFSIDILGNSIKFDSAEYGFWIIWNPSGDVKLGVYYKLAGEVDGLCGYFNYVSEDDKRKPDGSIARTTTDFGDSWAVAGDQPLYCESTQCPIPVQNKAWEMCNKVKSQYLSKCAQVVDIEAFISRCLETSCSCLAANENNYTAEEECRCQLMQNFVVDCLSANDKLDISEWRMQYDCPVTCEAPLVYQDCFQRKCEQTCESISDSNVCSRIPNVCFPGCYCPPGYVRKENTCIKPSACRDCECNVLPHLQYVTYDERNFTVNGNCVYVMSRDMLANNDQHKFQVLITNHPCQNNPNKMCIGKITILYQGHKIHILMDFYRNKLKLVVDMERIEDFEEIEDWAQVTETGAKHFKILLKDIQVETSVYFPSLGVSVKAPSHKYGGKLEGLCGNCNHDGEDDFVTPKGEKPEDDNDFALSWLYEHLPGGQTREQCDNKPLEECPIIPMHADPCLQLMDENKFGQCMPFYDPSLFIEWCKKDTCGGHPELACTPIETYARDCASAGFCINWRTDLCPAKACSGGQYYDPCGTGCPNTCDSIKSKDGSCKRNKITEGCFCPEGKVLLNDTCVEPKECEVCDMEGHHPGDVWKKDKCTTCTCEGSNIKCETKSCNNPVCERGYNSIIIPSKEDECCEKYMCVPEPTAGPVCELPQKINCRDDQILKLYTKPNGCQTFICECKPANECPEINTNLDENMKPGYMKEVDERGCCPVINLVCRKELCPDPEPCPQYHTLESKEVEGQCCPLHICEPPRDKCIFETEYTAASIGGERPQTRYEKLKLLKNGNETWFDGPCRECKCFLTSLGNYQHNCNKKDCPVMELIPEFKDYELKSEMIYDQCCPDVSRVACKHEGKTYKTGESWTVGEDLCTTMECIQTSNGIQKETRVQSCDSNCELGYEYKHSKNKCCGECVPVACVVDGEIYHVGKEWTSPDFCTNYVCLNVNGSMQVQGVVVTCDKPSLDYSQNFEVETVVVPGECCKKYKPVACKVNGKTYKVNETWPSSDDKCKNITCLEHSNGKLHKQESVESCDKICQKGWEYQESSDKCCGKCVQVACVVDTELKKPGQSWTSSDNCTTYTCDLLGDFMTVTSQQESCPSLIDCPPENIYTKGCCKHCNFTAEAQKLCVSEAIPLNSTIGLVKHGKCTNKKPINNFTECVGSCHSSTMYNIKQGMHESVCSCCQAVAFSEIEVDLTCENGSNHKKKLKVPTSCDCQGCSSGYQATQVKTKTKH